jgi:hypothetical protein
MMLPFPLFGGMQMLGVRGMAVSAALTFGAVIWWASRGTNPAAEGSAQVRGTPASHADASMTNAWVAPAVRDDAAGAPLPDEATAEDSRLASDASFNDYVEDKYRFLFTASAHSSRGAEQLRAALLERERLVTAINTARQGHDESQKDSLPEREEQLAALDRRIAAMLPAADIALYDALKDSHIEQFQLDDYAQGISNVAPLRDADRRAILLSKLTSRQRFRQVLEQSGLMRSDLALSQRQAALVIVTRALAESRESFLQEARQQLTDDEQYSLLANYENGEYRAELEKLRGIAVGGGS